MQIKTQGKHFYLNLKLTKHIKECINKKVCARTVRKARDAI